MNCLRCGGPFREIAKDLFICIGRCRVKPSVRSLFIVDDSEMEDLRKDRNLWLKLLAILAFEQGGTIRIPEEMLVAMPEDWTIDLEQDPRSNEIVIRWVQKRRKGSGKRTR